MSTATLCEICETGQAMGSCDRCGAPVCERHFVATEGLCTTCAQSIRSRPSG